MSLISPIGLVIQ